MKTLCTCTEKCTFIALPGEPYCIQHDPRPERAAAKREHFVRIASTRKKIVEVDRASLRSSDDLLCVLEDTLKAVRESPDLSKYDMATVVCKITSEARAIMKDKSEAENKEIKEVLALHHPDLVKQLRSVK